MADARREAFNLMHRVIVKREDPAADRQVQRGKLTFEALATRYVEEYAHRKNKSWKTAQGNVKRHLLPKWGPLKADEIKRTDVKA